MEDLSATHGAQDLQELPALPSGKSITQSKTTVDAESVRNLKQDIENLVTKPGSVISDKARQSKSRGTTSKATSPNHSKQSSRVMSRQQSATQVRVLTRQSSRAKIRSLSRQGSSSQIQTSFKLGEDDALKEKKILNALDEIITDEQLSSSIPSPARSRNSTNTPSKRENVLDSQRAEFKKKPPAPAKEDESIENTNRPLTIDGLSENEFTSPENHQRQKTQSQSRRTSNLDDENKSEATRKLEPRKNAENEIIGVSEREEFAQKFEPKPPPGPPPGWQDSPKFSRQQHQSVSGFDENGAANSAKTLSHQESRQKFGSFDVEEKSAIAPQSTNIQANTVETDAVLDQLRKISIENNRDKVSEIQPSLSVAAINSVEFKSSNIQNSIDRLKVSSSEFITSATLKPKNDIVGGTEEISSSAPCLALTDPVPFSSANTENNVAASLHSIQYDSSGMPSAPENPSLPPIGAELRQLKKASSSRHGSKDALHNHSIRSTPRSSVTFKNTKSWQLKYDRNMPDEYVLTMLSTVSIHPEINNKQMSKFLSGFRRFQKTYFGDNSELFDSLKKGQSPKTLLIACCDSRVDPAIITDCEPGDLFVVRNVANLVAPYNPDGSHHGVSAALEFAVKGLKVNNIIVMGHTKCGGIAALMRGISDSNETEFLGPWMKIAEKARNKVLKHFSHKEMDIQNRACEHASILLSLENLVSYPWVREKLMNESISIHGWYFDFEDGELLALNPDTLVFEPLVEADESKLAGLNILGKENSTVEEHEDFSSGMKQTDQIK